MLNATFQADFSSFVNEVTRAEGKLLSFEQGASKVATAFQGIGTQSQQAEGFLSRFGGTAGLVEGAVSAVVGVATFAATAVAALGAAAFKATYDATQLGASLDDMSEITGVSVENLSAWRTAIISGGGDMDKFTNLLFTMQQRMETRPTTFIQGLDAIGLSMKDIDGLAPDELILRLSQHWKTLGPEVNTSAAAMQLFGARGREFIPLLNEPLEELIRTSKELGLTWSTTDAQAAEDLQRQTKLLGLQFKDVWQDIGREFIPVMLLVVTVFRDVGTAVVAFVRDHLGGSLQGAIQKIGLMMLAVADSAIDAVRLIAMGWSGLSSIFNGVAAGFLTVTIGVGHVLTKMAELVSFIPGLGAGYGEVATRAKVFSAELQVMQGKFSDQSAAAMDGVRGNAEFHTSLDVAGQSVQGVRDKLITMTSGIEDVGPKQEELNRITGLGTIKNKEHESAIKAQKEALDLLKGSTIQLTDEQKKQIESAREAGLSADQIGKAYGINEVAVKNYMEVLKGLEQLEIDVHKRSEEDRKKMNEQLVQWAEERNTILTDAVLLEWELTKQHNEAGMDQASLDYQQWSETLAEFMKTPPVGMEAQWEATRAAIRVKLDDIAAGVEFIGPRIEQAGKAGAAGWVTGFAIALQSGGGLMGTLDSAIDQIGSHFAKKLGESINNSAGASTGFFDTLNLKAGLASGAVGGLAAAMESSSAKSAIASVAMTGLAVGVTAYAAASAASAAAVAAGGVATAGMVGGAIALGAATAGVGLAAVAAYYGLKKLLNDTEKEINPVRQAFVDTAGGIAALGERARQAGTDLTLMLDAKNPEQYEAAIDALNAAFEFQDIAMNTLAETAKKYGFTLSELGPALAKGELDKQAQQLYADFQVLVAGGLDVVAITTRMAESTNKYVQDAVKMGAEVPSAMKPMIERMIEMGLLTDSAGKKVTDLEGSGITFSTTMSQGFANVVTVVEKLTDAIARGLGISLDTTTAKAKTTGDSLVDATNRASGGVEQMRADYEVHIAAARVAADQLAIATGGGLVDPLSLAGREVEVLRTRYETALAAARQSAEALGLSITNLPDDIFINANIDWAPIHIPYIPPVNIQGNIVVEAPEAPLGYQGGTHGEYKDFGAGTLAVLHGRERIMTENEPVMGGGGIGNADVVMAVDRLLAAFLTLPETLARTQRDTLLLASAGRR